MAQSAQPASVEDLLSEADRLVAEIDKQAGRGQKLISARDKVAQLPADQKTLDQADVVVLKAEVQFARKSLKDTGENAFSQGMVYTCIVLSVFLMFMVGSLSLVYNRGVALLSEVETLAAQQPDRRFGQLERQLLVAQDELFSPDQVQTIDLVANTDSKSVGVDGVAKRPIDELARESSYLTLHELRDLNFKLKSLENRVGEFEHLSDSPFPAVLKLETTISAAMDSGRHFVGAFKTADVAMSKSPMTATKLGAGDVDAAKQASSPNDAMNFFCQPHPPVNPGNEGSTQKGEAKSNETTQAIPEAAPSSDSQVLGMDMRKIVDQACKYSLNYVSMTVPPVDSWAVRIKDSIDPYAVWILPCLYAALGSMIYYMRLILDATQPNPPIHRIAHRMALAALAGMILAWFWGPTFGGNSEFKSVGFGLFTFAFIVGFSIDVFFALLDRLVFVSTNAISKLGTT